MIKQKKYIMLTKDPLHIGDGGLTLGKIDNPITKDPCTHVPKVPGSGVAGPNKYYTDLKLVNLEQKDSKFDIGRRKHNTAKDTSITWCASTEGKCGDDCLMCYTFGYSTDSINSKGVLAYYDANILFFPVYSSMLGQVWITSQNIYNSYFDDPTTINLHEGKVKASACYPDTEKIEIGGLIFEIENVPLQPSFISKFFIKLGFQGEEKKVYIVPDSYFSFLVQKNLEQRTCVAIDPNTGAAKPGALYSFEAIPANTILQFQVNMNEYKKHKSPFKKNEETIKRLKEEFKKQNPDTDIDERSFTPLDLIEFGFKGMEQFGFGGMNTRGFGRAKIIQI